jgi:prephenate dehydrogenase
LTYFVAKGFLDAGLELDSPLAPPSVRALRATIEAVRQDAAHLFVTLNRENEFAAEARRRFLDALLAVDAALNRAPEVGEGDGVVPEALELPDLGEAAGDLSEARDVIDELDE